MKTLQNNYTTPEQSKRLLELGVPADSADCYYNDHDILFIAEGVISKFPMTYAYTPCWSVGRLMEIYGICMGVEGFFYCRGNFINEAIRRIEYSVKKNLLDFSRLEE